MCMCIYIYIYIYTYTRFTWMSLFVDRMEYPCAVLWRPEALACRVLIPAEA